MNNLGGPEPFDQKTPTGSWLLAIDTSTEQLGLALTNGDAQIELSLPGGRQQTTTLLPLIEQLCDHAGIGIGDFGAVAVAIGPGSFTGLRVGLSVAKGLALAQGSAVIGIPTLDIVASPYRVAAVPIIAVLPAGRSRFVWNHVSKSGDATGAVNSNLDELLAAAREFPDALVVGELSLAVHDALIEGGLRVESQALGVRRTLALAELGYRRWTAGDVDDAASLESIYLHGRQTSLLPRSQR